ncbi:hypothetical protein JT06_07465 [Desulfobulbus sp. Tol-SR]|nr:hypothetical protein JT06_07465 [Desulfobulbus sp. Tol-SR]
MGHYILGTGKRPACCAVSLRTEAGKGRRLWPGSRHRNEMKPIRQTTILTIDDEAVIRRSIHAYLEDYDYRVVDQ